MYKPVIVYHHIKDGYKRGLTPDQFRAQVSAFRDTHVFSFDDGLREGYTVAYPFLRKHGLTGYFFVIGETLQGAVNHVHMGHALIDHFGEGLVSLWNAHADRIYTEYVVGKYARDGPRLGPFKNWLHQMCTAREKYMVFSRIMDAEGVAIDPEEYYLSASELREMADGGMVIGNHTMTHPRLSQLTGREQAHEIIVCDDLLFRATGRKPWAFAHPYGDYNEDTLTALRSYGYTLGFTTGTPLEVGRVDCADLVL